MRSNFPVGVLKTTGSSKPPYPTRIAGRDSDHAALGVAGAEEVAADRAEFPQRPAGVDPFEHGCHERTLEISAGGQQPGFDQASMHVPHDVPARLLSRLEGIEYVSAGRVRKVKTARSGRPSSSPRRNKLYELFFHLSNSAHGFELLHFVPSLAAIAILMAEHAISGIKRRNSFYRFGGCKAHAGG